MSTGLLNHAFGIRERARGEGAFHQASQPVQ